MQQRHSPEQTRTVVPNTMWAFEPTRTPHSDHNQLSRKRHRETDDAFVEEGQSALRPGFRCGYTRSPTGTRDQPKSKRKCLSPYSVQVSRPVSQTYKLTTAFLSMSDLNQEPDIVATGSADTAKFACGTVAIRSAIPDAASYASGKTHFPYLDFTHV
ncbi:uncharacterized protein B0H18DRAFT_957914 [Fomitopsis serialis]|uniref:uncharacterized protein n=1 Tax=Fomitopsis serialis TaxID=139415 RepID=UPI0020072FE1|nr:uncharacterized protein B0H18DRAFT_957914 [Neoantrodia serialis]KAH9918420.1 hypothetical protein B0H18DRAFT_957914 [Neoantrodia serialis]